MNAGNSTHKTCCLRYCLFLIIAACCCLSSPSYAQYEALLHKTHGKRMELLLQMYHSTLRKDSITIFKKIDSIRTLAIRHKDDDLLMETGLMEMHYYYYNDRRFPVPVVEHLFDSLKTEAIEQKKLWMEASIENMEALYYFYFLKRYDLAFEHHLRVYDLIRDLSPKEYPDKQNVLNQIAMEYYTFNDFRESIFYNQEALKAEAETPEVFKYHYVSLDIMNTIGLCFQQLNQLDSADYYFREALTQALQAKNVAWEGISSGNLGYGRFLRGDYDAAIPLLQTDLRIGVKRKDWGLSSNSLMVLANISLDRQQVGQAAILLDTARQYAYRSGQYRRLQRLYPLLSKLYAAQNKPALSAIFLDSALFVKDSFIRQLHTLQMVRTNQRMQLDAYRAEIKDIQNRKQINKLQRDILLIAVLAVMIVVVFIYRAQRKKYRLKQEQFAKAEEDLAFASRELADFAKHISEKNTLIEMLQEQQERQDNRSTEALQQLQQRTILTEEEWQHFRALFEKVHSGFLDRLKEKLPGLTPAETRFIVLGKLGLSNKEMAATLGIGADAIRQYRSRLRKKLDLGEDGSLEDLVAQI